MLKTIENAISTAQALGNEIVPKWDEDVDILLGLDLNEIEPYTDKEAFHKEWNAEKRARLKNLPALNTQGLSYKALFIPIKLDSNNTGYIVAITGFRDVRKTFWVIQYADLALKIIKLSYHLSSLSTLSLSPENPFLRKKAIEYLSNMKSFKDMVKDFIDIHGCILYQNIRYITLDETTLPTQHPLLIFALLRESTNDPTKSLLLHDLYEHSLRDSSFKLES